MAASFRGIPMWIPIKAATQAESNRDPHLFYQLFFRGKAQPSWEDKAYLALIFLVPWTLLRNTPEPDQADSALPGPGPPSVTKPPGKGGGRGKGGKGPGRLASRNDQGRAEREALQNRRASLPLASAESANVVGLRELKGESLEAAKELMKLVKL